MRKHGKHMPTQAARGEAAPVLAWLDSDGGGPINAQCLTGSSTLLQKAAACGADALVASTASGLFWVLLHVPLNIAIVLLGSVLERARRLKEKVAPGGRVVAPTGRGRRAAV